MFRMHPPFQAGFRSPSQEEAWGQSEVGVFYVGLGDQFDDDRRLVHETAAGRLTLGAALLVRSRELSSRLRASARGSTA
jgi:hypothetical protein